MTSTTPNRTSVAEQARLVDGESTDNQEPAWWTLVLANNGRRVAWIQAGTLAIVASIWCLVLYSTGGKVPFALYHPLFVSLGLLLLIQGVLVLQPTQSQPAKKVGLQAHQIFVLFLGLPLLTLGVWIMWHAHSQPGAKHFISLHGILGVVLLVLLWLQAVFGISTVWGDGQVYGSSAKAKSLWKYHRYGDVH